MLTVRFEMPFAVWCTGCPREVLIGQGVRFNAEKKKVGAYHTTPIYSFRMRHPPCGGTIEIRTDPQNTAYVVTAGARKRDTGENVVREGDVEVRSEAEKARLRDDAFAALEVTIDDRAQAARDKSRIEGLWEARERDWEDPYAASRKLRRTFRVERKGREKEQARTEALQERMSLGIDLLPESQADRLRASLVDFEGGGRDSRSSLRKSLAQNTRDAVDPFLTTAPTLEGAGPIAGLKRKRKDTDAPAQENSQKSGEPTPAAVPLVDYESD